MPLKVEPILEDCLKNAERLVESAKAVRSVPGCNHIAFSLAVLALEEIGKSILLFQESLEIQSASHDGQQKRRPIEWIEDHERKLFWAIWSPEIGANFDWRTIPQHMDAARFLHLQRLQVLYFDPSQSDAQAEMTSEYVSSFITRAEARLQMEKFKRYKELSEQEKADLQWFSIASADPQLKPVVFSKVSMEKQAELIDERSGWIKWLRKTIEDSQRAAHEAAQREFARQPPGEHEEFEDKWSFRIKLKSASHSIRQNQLQEWNKNSEKLKLFKGGKSDDLTVDFTMPKAVAFRSLWSAGMHFSVRFVVALNVGSLGYFWWYLPTFTSRFHDQITDLDTNFGVEIDRMPQLKLGWPNATLSDQILTQAVAPVYAFVSGATQEQFAVYHKYFGTLALMAKNDIFFQFEHNIVHDFSECFETAMRVYGDWDGRPERFESAVLALFPDKEGKDDFLDYVMSGQQITQGVKAHNLQRAVTLEDAAKAKIVFDTYIQFKTRSHFISEIKSGNLKPDGSDN
jgi:AbiV family abortive infection protein